MNRSGRISFVGLMGLVGLVVFVVVLLMGRESLTTIGSRFMDALARGDVDTLTKMSYAGNESPEEIRKQWDFSVNHAGRYFNFIYRVTSAAQADSNTASVRLGVTLDPTNPGSYEQNFQLPLVKVGDDWKVDVKAISREMYPALPR